MKRGFVRKLVAFALAASWGIASLSGVEVVPDTRKIEPLAVSTGDPAVRAAQAKILGAPDAYAAAFPVFIHLSRADSDIPRKVAGLGGRASAVLPRLYAGALPRDAARYVSNWPEVAYIEAGKRARPLLDQSRPATFADIVQAGGSGLPASYSGTGSFVGIVDTGLSQNHLDFHINGTAQSRVAQWFPGQATAGIDNLWHGTHVAGIAGGNGFSSAGLYTGMAPGAQFLISKSSFLTANIPSEINTVLSAAGASPVAVNLSLGTMIGPHDGTSGFEQSVNSSATGTAGTKRIIAVAAGNEQGAQEHFQTALPPFGSVAVPLTVAAWGATVDIWADGGDKYTVTASILSGGTTSVGSDQPPNGATHFQVFFYPSMISSATVTIQRTRNGGSGRIDAYIEGTDGAFDASASVDAGTLTEPANGDNVLAVGSFNTKLPAPPASYGALGAISSFSSLGPTRDGRRKPDVAAPGAILYSAKSLDGYDPAAGSPPSTVSTNDNYAIMAGTSMAAPHVTGIAALVWQSNTSLTGAQMRARLKKTADLPAGVPLPDDTWGYGKIDALKAASQAVASITAPAKATPGAAVALSSENSSAAFNPSSVLSYAWSLPGRPAGSGAALSSTAASTTFTPDVPGNYTIQLSVAQTVPSLLTGTDNVVLHVNNIPVATVAAPPGSDNIVPATFHATGTDADNQALQFHWVLVSRPSGSNATLVAIPGTDNATLNPDLRGAYEIGARADDGLDNSALAIASFWAGPPPASVGHGGGCSVAGPGTGDPGAAAGTAVLLLVASAGLLVLRLKKQGTK